MAAPTDLHSIPGLVQRLRSSRRVEQARAALALGDLLAAATAEEGRADVASAIVAAGGVPPLVQRLASSGGAAVQFAAAAVLRNILYRGSEENRAAVIAAAGPAALARLLQHGSSADAITAAAAALGNLSPSAGGSQAIQQAGAVPTLVGLLRHAEPAVQAAAANALCGLSGHVGCGTELVSVGGIPVLLHVLQSDTEPYLQERAAAVLGNLAMEEGGGHWQALIDAGSIAALVRCLHSSDPGLRAAAASSLWPLVEHGSSGACAAVQAAGGFEILALLLQQGERNYNVLNLLTNLTAHSLQCCHQLAAAGGLAPLVACARSSPARAQAAAARVLFNMTLSAPELRLRLVAVGAVGALQQAALSGSDEEARDRAAEALAALRELPAGSGSAADLPLEAAEPPPPQQQQQQQQNSARALQRVCAAPGCGATAGLRRCGGCSAVRYCSEACSRAHWRAHKAECRRLQAEWAAAAVGAAPAGRQ